MKSQLGRKQIKTVRVEPSWDQRLKTLLIILHLSTAPQAVTLKWALQSPWRESFKKHKVNHSSFYKQGNWGLERKGWCTATLLAQLAYSCSGPSYSYPTRHPEESVYPLMTTQRAIWEGLWGMGLYSFLPLMGSLVSVNRVLCSQWIGKLASSLVLMKSGKPGKRFIQ